MNPLMLLGLSAAGLAGFFLIGRSVAARQAAQSGDSDDSEKQGNAPQGGENISPKEVADQTSYDFSFWNIADASPVYISDWSLNPNLGGVKVFVWRGQPLEGYDENAPLEWWIGAFDKDWKLTKVRKPTAEQRQKIVAEKGTPVEFAPKEMLTSTQYVQRQFDNA